MDDNLPAVRQPPATIDPSIKGFRARVMVEWPPDSGNWGIIGEGVVQEAGWEEDIQPVGFDSRTMIQEYVYTGYRTIRLTVRRNRD